MTTVVDERPRSEVEQVAVEIVDCDVHLQPPNQAVLLEYLPEPWRTRYARWRVHMGREAYNQYWSARRLDSIGPDGGLSGSEPGLVHRQLFDEAGVDLALVLPQVRLMLDPDFNRVIVHAYNRWLHDTWLTRWSGGGRLLGSICVAPDDPEGAVREIEEWGGCPEYKQVLIGHYSEQPLGMPRYEPVWEAAARHGLPVAMHFSGNAAQALGATPVGRFPRFIDYHAVAFPLTYSAQLVSLLCNGVFDRHPGLRVVFVEGGFLWYRPLLTRLAAHWDQLRLELPVAGDDPLQYIRDHVRFTTQPIEESPSPRDAARLMEAAEADTVLMISSDYPHYDFDDPRHALPPGLTKRTRRRVMCENALELYGLPATRPAVREVVGPDEGQR